MGYRSVLPSRRTRPLHDGSPVLTNINDLLKALQLNFNIFTWMLLGASLQALAVWLFSTGRYTMLFAVTIFSLRFIKGALETYGFKKNPYLQDVIPHRVTTLIPSAETGELEDPAQSKMVVLHLGAKSNHPLGLFAPQMGIVGDWLEKMDAVFMKDEVPGFLGQTGFNRWDERGAVEVVYISYWRSLEDIWNFAHTGVHRETWQWWEKTIKENDYIGINHEIFEADAKHWENVYVNFQPTMMGATTYLKRGGKSEAGIVPDEYINPLVDASRGKLAKSSGRLGRELTRLDHTSVAAGIYD